MKKLFLSILITGAAYATFAQQTQQGQPINPVTDQKQTINDMSYENSRMTAVNLYDVPKTVNNSFTQKFPDQANVTWYKYDKGYSASYTDENKMNRHIVYNMDGIPLYTGTKIESSALPSTADSYLKMNYPNMKYNDVYEIVTEAGEKSYQVYMNGEWVKFDTTGNFIPVK